MTEPVPKPYAVPRPIAVERHCGEPEKEAVALDSSIEAPKDPWGREMVAQRFHVPQDLPTELRCDLQYARVPEGLTRYDDLLVWSQGTAVEILRYRPEHVGHYLEVTRGDEDAARRLQESSIQWNREMKHLVEEEGLSPGEARAKIREVDDAVFRTALESWATVLAAGVNLLALRLKPSALVRRPRQLPMSRPFNGVGQAPTVNWRPNGNGQVRSVDEAVAIAKKHGVDIPDDVKFVVADDLLPDNVWACYLQVAYHDATARLPWSMFFNKSGNIVVKLRSGLLASDEAIVAVLGHEMHEINNLRLIFERNGGSISFRQLKQMVAPHIKGNLHDQAWDVADKLVKAMRKAA